MRAKAHFTRRFLENRLQHAGIGLSGREGKRIGRPRLSLRYLQQQVHRTFTAARTQCDVDACQSSHHSVNGSYLVPVHGVGSPAWLFTDPSEVGKLFFEIGIEGMDQLGESG